MELAGLSGVSGGDCRSCGKFKLLSLLKLNVNGVISILLLKRIIHFNTVQKYTNDKKYKQSYLYRELV